MLLAAVLRNHGFVSLLLRGDDKEIETGVASVLLGSRRV